jgi:hypothetical protein
VPLPQLAKATRAAKVRSKDRKRIVTHSSCGLTPEFNCKAAGLRPSYRYGASLRPCQLQR